MYIFRRKIEDDNKQSDVNDDAPMTFKEEQRATGNNDIDDISDLCSFDFDDIVST